jgi:hypothetical protein
MSNHLLVIGSGPIGRGVFPLYFPCFNKLRIIGRDEARTLELDAYLAPYNGMLGKHSAKEGPGYFVHAHEADSSPTDVRIQKARAFTMPSTEDVHDGPAFKAFYKASAIALALDPKDFVSAGVDTLARGLIHRFITTSSDAPLALLIGMNVVDSANKVVRPALEKKLTSLLGEGNPEVARIMSLLVFHETVINQIAFRDPTPGSHDINTEAITPDGMWVKTKADTSDLPSPASVRAQYVSEEEFKKLDKRKIWGSNCLHAVLAYLDFSKHGAESTFVHSAWSKPLVADFMTRAAKEIAGPLAREIGQEEAEVLEYLMGALKRFSNPLLNDPITRVARDPGRKLGIGERLLGPALAVLEQGGSPVCLAQAIGWAIQYPYKSEDRTQPSEIFQAFQKARVESSDETGIRAVLSPILEGHPHGEELIRLVVEMFNKPLT